MGTLAAGIKEIFATAKTTGSNVMLCGNDGTPDGHMTMANLASVLGALSPLSDIDQNYTPDFDTLFDTGFHQVALGETLPNGYPSVGGENAYNYGILYVIHTPAFIQQIYITDQGSGNIPYATNHGIYIRGGYLSLADCTWTKISNAEYLNQYRNLSELANALGVNGYRTPLDAEHFAQVEISAIESSFQGKNNHEYWLFDFGAANYEGVALCYRHSNTTGEAVWITSDGLRIIKRDNARDDGTWLGWYVYKF